jgi:hypothetical protein
LAPIAAVPVRLGAPAVDPSQALIVALDKAGLSQAEAERINATEVPGEPVHKDKLSAR